MKSKILAIVGPTATGKTDLFLKLIADGYDFQAIIADSRQVYQYMDIGTGKDLPQDPEMRKKFWLVDSVTPDQDFSSSNFCLLAHQAIQQIFKQNSVPVVIGGTGRYLKDLESVPETLFVPPDHQIRQKLTGLTVPELQNQLGQINPQKLNSMNHSDRNNPRRLIRAIEIGQTEISSTPVPQYLFNTICLSAPLQLIKVKIKYRVNKRIQQGMVKEVQLLLNKYPNFITYQSSATPGYQEILSYINQEITLESAIDKWTQREIGYAKRQLTWFRHQTDAVWFDISQANWYAEIVKQLEKWGYDRSYS